MTTRFGFFSLICCFLFYGCGDANLHLKMQLQKTDGLTAGDAVVFKNEKVGTVTSVQSRDAGGYVANIVISEQHRQIATVGSDFLLTDEPSEARGKRVEIVQGQSGGKPLQDGAVVQGTPQTAAAGVFTEILKGFRRGLENLREETERFRQELQKVPDSEEARRLEQEWTRLIEEVQKAQAEAQRSLRQELLPKLQEELDRLRRKLEDIKPEDHERAKPFET